MHINGCKRIVNVMISVIIVDNDEAFAVVVTSFKGQEC
ncbi:MAG: hypothetical protein K0R46_1916 [Herbinix sp.]|jgi:hypothetical protein|nr:hypothetical protein [Herbinix sp.]